MKILIIDDDQLICQSLQTIIQAHQHQIVAIGHNGKEAISLYHKFQPDILLMDIRMEIMDGVSASKEILQHYPYAKILFLTTFSDDSYIIEALSLGVKGYILKQNFHTLITALDAIYQGQHVFNTEIVQKIPNLLTQTKHSDIVLTKKELECITLIAKGYNNKEIASLMFLSEGTIRNQISSLLTKLSLRDRTQLAIYYFEYLK